MSAMKEVVSEHSPEAELLSQLEKSKQEFDEMMQEKEKMDRTRQEQELEAKLEMRETIEMLKEESLMKDEILSKYENQQKITEDEVSKFYSNIQTFIANLLQKPEPRADGETWWHGKDRVKPKLRPVNGGKQPQQRKYI